jgi:type VI secretion system secreted protein VgrG
MPEAMTLQMELVTTLGKSLRFRSLTALEEISRLFEFQLVALSEDPDISADKLLGTDAAVSVELAEGTKRWFHGIVAAFGIEGVDGRHFTYGITVRPWAWLMTRSADVRIFQEKSAVEIVEHVFNEYKGTFVNELKGTYDARIYCVQYRETDFNFVSRLLEEEGIFYYFRHSEDKHELVLADEPGTHAEVPKFAKIPYFEDVGVIEATHINAWHMRHEIQPGKFTLSDYDFEKPNTPLKSDTVVTERGHGEAAHEVYDYPGLYLEKDKGSARAQIRVDEQASRFTRFTGQGNTPGLVTGTRFTLERHPRADQNVEHLVLQTQIEMRQAGYESGAAGDNTRLHCRFVAQLFAEPFRPARTTHKPTVAGPQTALVVGGGDAGDIETDKHGRIKVQFHWDREGKKNAQSSCWLRVATSWAGNGWGMISLPRLGQEVVVAFLEGDPDQPLVVGSVYNGEQLPPYVLPDNATVSTWKSRTKKGATDKFNELRFEDKPGDEYVLMQAQKDRLAIIKETSWTKIGASEHRTIGGDHLEKVAGDFHFTVSKGVKQRVDAKHELKVAEDILMSAGGKHSLKAGGDITAESGTAYSIKAGTDMHVKVGVNAGVDAGVNVHIKGGVNVVIEAGVQLTLKAGGSFITIDPAMVAIKGPLVMINSGGAAGSGNGASPVAPTAPEAPKDPAPPKDPLPHR